MNTDFSSMISDFISVDVDEHLSKVIKLFKKKRELLVFDEKGTFVGYLTERYLTRQSKLQADAKVSNYLKSVPTISKDSTLDSVARAILSDKIQSVPVEEDGKIIGVFKDIDAIRLSAERFKDKKVKELMTQNPLCITPNTPIARMIALSRTNNISRIPVVDESNQLIGIVSPHDVSSLILADFPSRKKGDRSAVEMDILSTEVKNVMTEDVVVCNANDKVLEAIVKLYQTDHKALVVVDKSNHPLGILTTTDLLENVSKPPQTEGYYVRVLGDVDDADMDQVIEMGVELVKKFASMIGSSGQLYIHSKAIPKKKFRGLILYQIRMRVSTDKGNTYVAKAEGYGVFGAYAVALDRLEREIISERELELQSRHTGSERYILEELEDI